MTAAQPVATVLPESRYAEWERLVAASPEGSPYATPSYLEVLCEATGGSYRVLAVEGDGELLGGLAVYQESRRFGTVSEPRLLLFYNGVVLRGSVSKYPSERSAKQVTALEALEPALRGLRLDRLCLKQRSPLSDLRVFVHRGWRVAPTFTYVVRIGDLSAAWERVENNLRRLVRRGEREGLTISEDDDFDRFFALHLDTHRRKGAPLYLPEDRFARWFRRLRESGIARLFHARTHDGISVAAQIVLAGTHPVTHTVSAAADEEAARKLGANPFLRWKVFEALSAAGYVANDLTNAALDAVTHFKSQLGGDLETCMTVALEDSPRMRWGRRLTGVRRS